MKAGTLKAAAITTELSQGLVLSLNKLFCVACALVARPFQPSHEHCMSRYARFSKSAKSKFCRPKKTDQCKNCQNLAHENAAW